MRWLVGLRCGRVRKRRWRYLDNTLSARERAWVNSHLERCIGCRAEFARAAFAIESLQKGLMPEPHLLPSRSKRWVAMLSLLVLLGLVGGLWLAHLHGFMPFLPSGNKVEGKGHPLSAGTSPSSSAVMPSETRDLGSAGASPVSFSVRQAPRPPTAMGTREKGGMQSSKKQSSKKQPVRKKVALPRKRNNAPLPEGVVEVFDESGQLVQREQMRGTR